MTAADILRIIEKGGRLWPCISRISIGGVVVFERTASCTK